MDRFTWNEEEHAKHFPKLKRNQDRTRKAKSEIEDRDKKAKIEQIKNDKLYGEK